MFNQVGFVDCDTVMARSFGGIRIICDTFPTVTIDLCASFAIVFVVFARKRSATAITFYKHTEYMLIAISGYPLLSFAVIFLASMSHLFLCLIENIPADDCPFRSVMN